MPPPGPSEDTAREAYRLWVKGLTYAAIAAELDGKPQKCGGATTAYEWVQKGRVVEHRTPDSELAGTEAQRERQAAAIDALCVMLWEDASAGRVARGPAYDLLIKARKLYINLMGLSKAPEARTLNVEGLGGVGIDPGVNGSLKDPVMLAEVRRAAAEEVLADREKDS